MFINLIAQGNAFTLTLREHLGLRDFWLWQKGFFLCTLCCLKLFFNTCPTCHSSPSRFSTLDFRFGLQGNDVLDNVAYATYNSDHQLTLLTQVSCICWVSPILLGVMALVVSCNNYAKYGCSPFVHFLEFCDHRQLQ